MPWNNKQPVGVYILHNPNTDETYVGSGTLVKRESYHRNALLAGNHHNFKLQRAFGKDPNFDFVGLVVDEEGLTAEENRKLALAMEQATIDENADNPLLLNIVRNVEAPRLGVKESPEAMERRRKVWDDPEYRSRMSRIVRDGIVAGTHFDRSGHVASAETRALQSKVAKEAYASGTRIPFMLGKKLSANHVEALRQARVGLVMSAENKEKLSERMRGNAYTLGRKQSQAVIDKRVEKLVGQKRSPEALENIRAGIRNSIPFKPVVDGTVYETYTEAAIAYDVDVTTVKNRINSKTDRFKGWTETPRNTSGNK